MSTQIFLKHDLRTAMESSISKTIPVQPLGRAIRETRNANHSSRTLASFLCSLFSMPHLAAQSQWSVETTFHIGGEGGWDYVTVDVP